MSAAGKTITCKAAVAWEAGKPLSIEEVEVQAPQKGEVRVKVNYIGLCHTDAYTLSGSDPEGTFPAILGHEGAGVVESVGEGVEEFKEGQSVILMYTAECKKCKMCTSGKTNLCQSIRAYTGRGVMPDETRRFKCKGKELYHYMGLSAMSQFTVVSQYSLVAVDDKASQEKTCLLGCGISTGFGAATKTAKVEEGSTVAVFGVGCVGLAVIEGAVFSKAKQIIAVDINDGKEEWAKKWGATDFVNSTKLKEDQSIVDKLVEMTDGGLDYTFDCTGNVKVMRSALEACHKGWGVSTIIGVAAAGQEIATRPFQLVTGRKWQGSAFGGVKGKTDLPGIVEKYLNKEIKIDEYITHRIGLDDINKGFDYMKDPKSGCIRCVVDMSS